MRSDGSAPCRGKLRRDSGFGPAPGECTGPRVSPRHAALAEAVASGVSLKAPCVSHGLVPGCGTFGNRDLIDTLRVSAGLVRPASRFGGALGLGRARGATAWVARVLAREGTHRRFGVGGAFVSPPRERAFGDDPRVVEASSLQGGSVRGLEAPASSGGPAQHPPPSGAAELRAPRRSFGPATARLDTGFAPRSGSQGGPRVIRSAQLGARDAVRRPSGLSARAGGG